MNTTYTEIGFSSAFLLLNVYFKKINNTFSFNHMLMLKTKSKKSVIEKLLV